MATIPQAFPETGTGAVASYDQSDIAAGIGIEDFYIAKDNAGQSLLSFTVNSESNQLQNSTQYTSGTFTAANVTQYDLGAFELPRVVKGTAYVQTFQDHSNTAGNDTAEVKLVFALTKNQAEFASGATSAVSLTAGNATSGAVLLKINVATEEAFGQGDILGVKYYVLGRISSEIGTDPTVRTTIGTSPLDKDGALLKPSTNPGETTITKISVPFRLDL